MGTKVYEYIVKIKDEFSKGFRDLNAAAGISNNTLDGTKAKLSAAANASSGLENTFKSLGRTIATVFAIGTISAFVGEARDASIKFDSYKKAFSVTTGDGGGTFEFVRKESDRLGLSLLSASEGYKTLSGATMGTNLAGSETQRIFTAVAQAGSKLKISADDQKGVFLALGQMLSKGKVSAEELRGQLGERMPGAFRLFADSLGVSTMQLDKMLQKGEVISADALPKFATMLEKTFGNGGARVESLAANMQRATDKSLLLKEAVGKSLEPTMNRLYMTFGKLFDWGVQNDSMLKGLITSVGLLGLGIGALGLAAKIGAINIGGITLANMGLAGSLKAIGIAMWANPFTPWLVGIAAVALAIGGIVTLMDKANKKRLELVEQNKQTNLKIENYDLNQNILAEQKKHGGSFRDAMRRTLDNREGWTQSNVEDLRARIRDIEKNPYWNRGSKLRDERSSLMEKLGFEKSNLALYANYRKQHLDSKPNMPVMTGFDTGLGDGGSSSSTATSSDGISSETGGKGKGVNVITHLGGIKIEINVAKLDEGLDQVEQKCREVISRIVNGGLYTATQ